MDSAVIVTPFNHASFKRRKNTWYTIASGNWSDSNIWMSNSHRRWKFPQAGDDVSIGLGHTVTCDTSASLNNLYVAGSLLFDSTARTITLAGDMQATGSVNMSNAAHNLVLFGVNNFIVSFTSGASSTVSYARLGFQYIMNQSYRNLSITASGTKELTSDLIVTGNFVMANVAPVLELQTYNLTINGTSTHGNGTILRTPSNTGAILLLVGKLSSNQSGAAINLGATNDLEIRGGYDWDNQSITARTMILSASQTLATSNGVFRTLNITGDISVKSGVTITQNYTGGSVPNSWIYHNGNLLAESSTSIWNLTTGGFNFFSQSAWDNKMSGGQFNISATAGLGFTWAGDFTIPVTSLGAIVISSATATGKKILSGSTLISGFISLTGSQSVLECSTFDLTVNGTTSGSISKTGAGNMLFIGSVTSTCTLTGNPTIEMRGGCGLSGNTGNGQVTFTTNNQSFIATNTWANPILISGAITLTNGAGSTETFANSLNGNNAASTFDNRGTLNYQNAQQPMLTGVLQTNLAANTFIYNAAGNQNVTGGTYRTLTLAGSGVKTLTGNVVVATLYTLTPPATLNTNGFTRT